MLAGGFSVFAGVGERTREGNDLYKEMIESVRTALVFLIFVPLSFRSLRLAAGFCCLYICASIWVSVCVWHVKCMPLRRRCGGYIICALSMATD